jgi:hypothetical protein
MIAATDRVQYVDSEVFKTLPRQGSGVEEFDMYFVLSKRELTRDEQKQLLAGYGLVPDYYGLIQVNIDDPAFSYEHPNGAQWDNNGQDAAFVGFNCGSESCVSCGHLIGKWLGSFWHAGRRKP